MNRDSAVPLKVAIFTVAMLLVAAGLVITFGEFRFASTNSYHATFTTASRLQAGQPVRMAGIEVGSVTGVNLREDNSVDVAFEMNERYRLYTSSRAVVRYENLIGDRYLEITSGPGELGLITPNGTLPKSQTQPALDLDALLGGLRPVLNGLDGEKVNQVSHAVIELLQGQGGALSELLNNTTQFTTTLAGQDQLIGDVITNLNTVLESVNTRGAQFDASVDRLQQVISGLSEGRDPIAGAIAPMAATTTGLTELLVNSRRPLQGVVENLRPLATTMDTRKDFINEQIDPLAENYRRLAQLGAYGSYFNIYFCSVRFKLNGPAGSDILIPMAGPPDPSKGRCSPDG